MVVTKTVQDAYMMGQSLMNRASKQLGTMQRGGTEDRRFRSSFGCSAEVCVAAWNLMVSFSFLPEGDTKAFEHYLWGLMFMKIYPENETAMCTLLGGVDPKTMRKWVWGYIKAVHELSYIVVS